MLSDKCEKCGLHEGCRTPFMRANGPDEPVVLVIGEAPGEVEDERGVPFVGRSGKLLRQTLHEVGFDVDAEVVFTNVVRCRPPNNKITKHAINHCKQHVLDDIEKYDPDLVLLMGNSPLSAVLGEQGITTWNGVVVERDDRIYVPLFHPAFILRNDSAMDDWLKGMLDAVDALGDGVTKGDLHVEYIFPKTVEEVELMRDWLSGHEWIAYDTETSDLDAHVDDGLVLAVSFCVGDRAYAVPLDHPEAEWSSAELNDVVRAVRQILHDHDHKIIGHNIKFDQQHTRVYIGEWFEAGGDTMLVSHLLDSRRGIHGLKRLAGLHLGMYDYDKPLVDYYQSHPKANPYTGGSYTNIPLDTLLPYAAKDASATMMLHDRLYGDLTSKQKTLYHQLIIPASNALARVEHNGMALDGYISKRYHAIYAMVQQELYDDILSYKNVAEYVRYRQLGLDTEIAGTKRKRKVFSFNPNSDPQLRTLLYKFCGVPEPQERTDTGLPTVKSSVIAKHEDRFPLIALIRYHRLLGSMLSKCLNNAVSGKWQSDDGRVRSTYNLHGARTGRLSSTDPNLQNIPTPEKEPGTLLESLPIKNIFTHTFPNGVLMSVDYSGMELRVFASLADCEPMLEILRSDRDFHTMVASMVSGIPYDKITKPIRYRYKWTNWTMLFGGGAPTLHTMYGIPMSEAEEAVATYLDRFPEVKDYQDECWDRVTTYGYIESPFGRREHFPYATSKDPGRRAKARRAAVNMPVQSAASDITLMALVIIDHSLQLGKLNSFIVNTVHDSIVLDVHPDEVDKVATMCVSIMEGIVDMALFYMPGVDLSWLKCPLKADVEVGTHYGSGVSYEQWRQEQS